MDGAASAAVAKRLATLPIHCPEPPPRVDGRQAIRRRIRNTTGVPDLHVLWEQRFRAFASEVPRAVHEPRALCRHLSTRQWPFCGGRADAPQYNTLQLLLMPCAFTDHGRNFRGAIYDGSRVLNAQHATATPAFARGRMVRLETAAVALTPYGHLTDAHFYASTAPWVLQLLAVLPAEVRCCYFTRGMHRAMGPPAPRCAARRGALLLFYTWHPRCAARRGAAAVVVAAWRGSAPPGRSARGRLRPLSLFYTWHAT